MTYLTANKNHPYMGLDNKICKNPTYWCRLHQVWFSEEDVKRKRCKNKPTFDIIGVVKCRCLEKSIPWQQKKYENMISEGKGIMNLEEMKKELIDALSEMREEYFAVLFHECRLKDRHGNIWDIREVKFNDKWTILRLGLDGTENYSCVMIAADGHTNELREYKLIQKFTE